MGFSNGDKETKLPGRSSPVRRRRWTIIGAGILCFLTLLSFMNTKRGTFSSSHISSASRIPLAKQPIHFLLPATSTDVNLCKILLSASVLGYPIPVLINWKTAHENSPEGGKVSNLQKLSGTIQYLKTLKPEQSEDLVLMVDAFDIWFQLRVEVMLERYHAINQEADERLAQQFGGIDAMHAQGIRNNVLMAADKSCWTLKGPWCWLMPESPLPIETLGNETSPHRDWLVNWQRWPRYLNTGFVMGPASQILAILERAEDYVKHTFLPPASDQHFVSMVFAEQQLNRNFIQEQMGVGAASKSRSRIDQQQEEEELKHLALQAGRRYEFGIHLDYTSSLTHTAAFSAFDRQPLIYNTNPSNSDLGLDLFYDCKSHVRPLPSDISTSPLPFSSLDSNDADAKRSWFDIPLFTNVCTGEIPVTIHHNGVKTYREKIWTEFWMQHKAKELLAGMKKSEGGNEDGVEWKEGSMIEYKKKEDAAKHLTKVYPPGTEGVGAAGAMGDGGEKLSWDTLCGNEAFQAELFRLT